MAEDKRQAESFEKTGVKGSANIPPESVIEDDVISQMILATAYLFLNQRRMDPENTPDHIDFKGLPSKPNNPGSISQAAFGLLPDELANSIENIGRVFLDFMISRSIRQLNEMFEDVPEWLAELTRVASPGDLSFLNFFQEGMEELLPFIQEEVEELQANNPGPISFYDFMKGAGSEGEGPTSNMFHNVLRRARDKQELTQAAERLVHDLPYLQSAPPKWHTIPNNKLANELQKGLVNAGPVDLVVGRKGKRDITNYTMVSMEQNDDLKIDGNYIEYDRQVYNAVGTLYLEGHKDHMFTPAMLFRAVTSETSSADPSPQQIEAVIRSLEKLRNIHVYINITDEAQSRGFKDREGNPVSFILDDKMLSLRVVTARVGGKRLPVYKIQDEPLLFTYARMSGQLITVKSYLLDIREVGADGVLTDSSVSNTESRISIKGYLLRRVEVMKNDAKRAADNSRKYESERKRKGETKPGKELVQFSKQSNRILFKTLFNEAGITTTDRKTQQRNRDYAFKVLDYWKAMGYISGYARIKGDKNSIQGIDIEL